MQALRLTPDLLWVYLVTDPDMPGERGVVRTCQEAMEAGVRMVQLRDKKSSTRSLLETAGKLLEVTRPASALLVVNDRVDVAMASGADGVHLGQDDMPAAMARRLMGPDCIIGVSVRTPDEAKTAQSAGADYVAANLVFPTDTKTDLPSPLGLKGVARLRGSTRLPLLAIGGIDHRNAAEVIEAGADGVAVVSAIMAADDPSAAAESLLQAVRKAKSG
jgi:thiamine-phosphate pyrophosphorylase